MSLSGQDYPVILVPVASPAPTPQDLYERVRTLTGASSDFDLAVKLTNLGVPIGEKTLARMKKGGGVEWETAIGLLRVAGWICRNGDANPRARLYELERFAAQAERGLVTLRERVAESLEPGRSADPGDTATP